MMDNKKRFDAVPLLVLVLLLCMFSLFTNADSVYSDSDDSIADVKLVLTESTTNDALGSPIEGATFKLWAKSGPAKDSYGDRFPMEGTTDGQGEITISDLPIGEYYFVERIPADGFYASASYMDGSVGNLNFSISASNRGQTIVIGDQYNRVTNSRYNVELLLKSSEATEPDKVLTGAAFELYKMQEGSKVKLRTLDITDENGKAQMGNLLEGTYYLRELTPPTGYRALAGDFEFTVTRPVTSEIKIINVTNQIFVENTNNTGSSRSKKSASVLKTNILPDTKINIDDMGINVDFNAVSQEKVESVLELIKTDSNISMINNTALNIEMAKTGENTNNAEPLSLTLNLKESQSQIKDTSKLCLVRINDNGSAPVSLTRLGGSYDDATGKFTALITEGGDYAVMEISDIVKLFLVIGDNTITNNGEQKLVDITPKLSNNRTMLPLRAIAEMLGAEVRWNNKAREAVVQLDGKEVSLKVDKEIEGYGISPIIENGRTLVPIRYISEELDANVLWIPSKKAVQIVK